MEKDPFSTVSLEKYEKERRDHLLLQGKYVKLQEYVEFLKEVLVITTEKKHEKD